MSATERHLEMGRFSSPTRPSPQPKNIQKTFENRQSELVWTKMYPFVDAKLPRKSIPYFFPFRDSKIQDYAYVVYDVAYLSCHGWLRRVPYVHKTAQSSIMSTHHHSPCANFSLPSPSVFHPQTSLKVVAKCSVAIQFEKSIRIA